MRISDWSSDVCSSDLRAHRRIDVGVAPGDAVARRAREEREAAHERAADAENVKVHGIPILSDCPRAPENPAVENEIGRASCRERVCQYVWISVGAVSLKKKK